MANETKETLATKYRPKTFDDVTEQENIKIILTQQLRDGAVKNAYLFTGPAGCGKTTCARIFANEINKGVGSPIEIDAASHSGADDVRVLTEKAKMKPLVGDYNIFIVDECMTGDVEILTNKGFKRFDMCDGTEVVAQYNDGKIEFVEPLQWVKNHYDGEVITWSPRNWCSITMTPNHVQPLFYNHSQQIKEKYIKDIKFAQSNSLVVSGRGTGSRHYLTPMDRLAIVCQADATIQQKSATQTHWSIQLTKERKINRLLEIFKSGNIPFNEIKGRHNTRRFTFNTPPTITKYFNTHFDLDFDFTGAHDFINEVTFWDGYITDKYLEYVSTEKSNSDFVSAVAFLGGYSARQRVQVDNRKKTYKDVHKVFLYNTFLSTCTNIAKTVKTRQYIGDVYCVKVPSHQIVIKSQGFVFVTGNCHSISNAGWQAFLKCLEEPPKQSIFMFATTDPQKIPKTILSRVQRFDFTKISQVGICKRLYQILQMEDINCNPHLTEAVEYISKLSSGGMRDAITLLDKCLAYSTDLTLANVVKVVGAVDYDTMFKITKAIIDTDIKRVIYIVEEIANSGKDIKLFIKSYLSFMLDVCKYDVMRTFDYIQIPAIYSEQISWCVGSMENLAQCQRLLKLLMGLCANLRWETSPKTVLEANLYQLCMEV